MLEKLISGMMAGGGGGMIGSKTGGDGNRIGMGMGQIGMGRPQLPVQGQAPMMSQPNAQPPQAMPGGPSPELLARLLPMLMQNSQMMGGLFKQQPQTMNSSLLSQLYNR